MLLVYGGLLPPPHHLLSKGLIYPAYHVVSERLLRVWVLVFLSSNVVSASLQCSVRKVLPYNQQVV